MEQSLITDDVINMINEKNERVKEKSLKESKIEIKGECYRTREKAKQKIINAATNIMGGFCMIAFFSGALYFGYISEKEDLIRSEINDTYVTQNLIGGQYVTVNEHDEDFRNHANNLESNELIKWFDDTSKSMLEESEGKLTVDDIVDEMEDNYLEEKGRLM